MLREINTRAGPGGGRKQWFTDQGMDLFLWWDESGSIARFQLACKTGGGEHALTWTASAGFLKHEVDDGEQRPGRHKAAPVLNPSSRFPVREATEAFVAAAAGIDPEITEFVVGKLNDAGEADR